MIPLRPLSEYVSEAEFVTDAVKAAVIYRHDPVTAAAIAIAQGIADGEAGREQPFEEYVAEMRAKHEARKAAQQPA